MPSSQHCPPAMLPPRIHSWEMPEDTPGMPSFLCIPGSPGSSWVCLYCCPAGGSHSAQQCDHSLPNRFQSKWQGYTSVRLVLVTWLCCCRAGDKECLREQHPPEQSAVIQWHSPTCPLWFACCRGIRAGIYCSSSPWEQHFTTVSILLHMTTQQ